MSSNKLLYDDCQYNQRLTDNKGQLSYVLNPIKYEHQHKCRMELGIYGGSETSIINGNFVDLESDLKGVTRPMTQTGQCPTELYHPNKPIVIKSRETGKQHNIDTSISHLPCCQLVNYPKYSYTPSPPANLCEGNSNLDVEASNNKNSSPLELVEGFRNRKNSMTCRH